MISDIRISVLHVYCSWSISTTECCRTGGSNQRPPKYQSDAHSTEVHVQSPALQGYVALDIGHNEILPILCCFILYFNFNFIIFAASLQKERALRFAYQSIICVYGMLLFGCALTVSETYEPPQFKTNKMTVHPAKTQISLGFRPVWSESSLCAQLVAKDQIFLHADSEGSDQTGRMPKLIWVFAGRTCHFVGFVMRRLILSVAGSLAFTTHLHQLTVGQHAYVK